MKDPLTWYVMGKSVRGASHLRMDLPNQDAIHWLPASGVGPPIILGVSDGHGSPKSFRSQIGSRLAVEQSAWLVQDLLDGQPDPANLSAVKRTAEDYLPREIVRRWQQTVEEHIAENPFTEEELAWLAIQQGSDARVTVEENPLLAYGATILIVLVT
ncbi:MAG: protein phosphatase 2C domain-containing protein, partial [Anaerolineae bacterium]|nr:protein phosphatase 2C domain-containing protein [Anaerolineae bacterium]